MAIQGSCDFLDNLPTILILCSHYVLYTLIETIIPVLYHLKAITIQLQLSTFASQVFSGLVCCQINHPTYLSRSRQSIFYWAKEIMNEFAYLMVVKEGRGSYQCMVVKGERFGTVIVAPHFVIHVYYIMALQGPLFMRL
jgi:hypothetical protein